MFDGRNSPRERAGQAQKRPDRHFSALPAIISMAPASSKAIAPGPGALLAVRKVNVRVQYPPENSADQACRRHPSVSTRPIPE